MTLADAMSLEAKAKDPKKFEDALQRVTGIRVSAPPETIIASAGFHRSATKTPRVEMAKPALCQPELTTVELDLPNDDDGSGVFYYPTCTRVNRCGGCCSHELLSCQSMESERLKMSVVRTRYVGAELQYDGLMEVKVKVDKKCRCDCRVKEEDCNTAQRYLAHECRCECKNIQEAYICSTRPSIRFWDPKKCRCTCKNPTDCSTGMRFDAASCRCVRNLEMGMSRSLSPKTSSGGRQKSKKREERDRVFSETGEMIRVAGEEKEEAAEHLEQPHSTHN